MTLQVCSSMQDESGLACGRGKLTATNMTVDAARDAGFQVFGVGTAIFEGCTDRACAVNGFRAGKKHTMLYMNTCEVSGS